MERLKLLITDVDGTLLGDDKSLELFAAWYENVRPYYRLAYSSGRFVHSVMASIDSSMLPEPDAIIGGVGTQIYDLRRRRSVPLWPPAVLEWNPYIVQSIGAEFAELKLQPAEFNSHLKVSFYGDNLGNSFLNHFKDRMRTFGQQVSTVYSSQRDLDVLPMNSNKGAAAAFLARYLKISSDSTLVAGDSGNDAEMFRVGFRGIVVGNASSELKAMSSPGVYVAQSDYAAGVLEGVRYWHTKDCERAQHV